MLRAAAFAVLVLIAAPAQAMTGAGLLSENEGTSNAYIWGVTETLALMRYEDGPHKLMDHRQKCLSDAAMTNVTMGIGVRRLIENTPELMRGPAYVAVARFLYEMCGPPPK